MTASTVRATLRMLTGAETTVAVSSPFSGVAMGSFVATSSVSAVREHLPGFGLKLAVDGDGRLRAFGRRHDHELHVERGVADD
jgi:hypothetical protein